MFESERERECVSVCECVCVCVCVRYKERENKQDRFAKGFVEIGDKSRHNYCKYYSRYTRV